MSSNLYTANHTQQGGSVLWPSVFIYQNLKVELGKF